ncbi:MAG: phosphate ABC transporter, permease protein PstA [Oceanospirillaceae bacterium]|uniref:phosphate ABC transporter permease PstA n=1 Tax=unclassified Thalassolituus TaxID=2624967 RepID=UPI000C08F156|nr:MULTISPECIES: phosphate ABC transporter permease PstA [unclassified Thalassolituus]MAK91871.1 phosphate ABC transporter, permease protein PstA [Thalassolituus sp.]MAY00049.1 phosphate ABC transporter, permease protein PstA [Oceanospirillaceae bacterium]MBL36262.1 phosphate ABC transporter, permease protein PstA [Oceanospirillaceae bacterium]MBS53779.1 phosphate ABC transporter, permease protein PstA [Oceanospirillaceae bacterium]|tara:strand:- start:308 stop:1588 length:1281 start_codon:yes stop_codon:yes gene_type:complete
MTDNLITTREKVEHSMKRRRAAESRFRVYGMASVLFGLLCLVVLFGNILSKGTSAFTQTFVTTEILLDGDTLGLTSKSDDDEIRRANFDGLIKNHLKATMQPDGRKERRQLYSLISSGASWQLMEEVQADPSLIGKTISIDLLADDDVDQWFKHDRELEGEHSRLSDVQLKWLNGWVDSGALHTKFNTRFFTNGDSREPEMAGIHGAIKGTLLTLMVTFLLSFPIGVAAAIYLEEFAPKNKITEFVEININNLAAVPSITFGLLGLAIFINIFGVARSTPLVGGLVLTLMTLPTIIISGRAAIKAVPPSIREAAYGLGASKMQVVFHHVLPLALPGMLTGTIIGMAQALGETAPLLMIGMVAFVVDVPGFVNDPSTVLPVQIFLWSDSPERAFTERTSGAIIVLLGFLIVMNTAAVMLRRRLERRW